MSGSVNRVIIMGNLGRDPEIKTMSNGDKLANFSVATSDSWVDKRSGERQERTEWNQVVVFNPHLVGVIEKYISKGSCVHLIGQLQTREWTDRSGVKRHTTEVVLPRFGGELTIVSSPNKREGSTSTGDDFGGRPREAVRTDPRGNPQYSGGELDDSIPF